MNIKVLSNPEETFGNAKLQAVALSGTHIKLLMNNKVIYDCTDVTDCDMWDSIEYKNKQFDLHIYFSEDIESCDSIEEWLTYCSVEICGLEEVNGSVQSSYDYSVSVPMTFKFNPMILFKKECSECGNEFVQDEGLPYKYDPSRWLCDNCHDELMDD